MIDFKAISKGTSTKPGGGMTLRLCIQHAEMSPEALYWLETLADGASIKVSIEADQGSIDFKAISKGKATGAA